MVWRFSKTFPRCTNINNPTLIQYFWSIFVSIIIVIYLWKKNSCSFSSKHFALKSCDHSLPVFLLRDSKLPSQVHQLSFFFSPFLVSDMQASNR